MNQPFYPFHRLFSIRYTFISKGRRGAIIKVVEFSPTSQRGILNPGFGDLEADGTVNDKSKTNNNDIIKVLSTIIEIINDFTNENPGIKIVFTGNTPTRTALYRRILKMYFKQFSNFFTITALVKEKASYSEQVFDTDSNEKYLAFFIKRKEYF